jgi:hypothetical protein
MSLSRGEALAAVSKLLRTLSSAPDPKLRARAIYTELVHAEGWTPREREAIGAFGDWLVDYPSISEIKLRCEQLLGTLR